MGESSTDRGKTITLAATVKNIATVTAFLERELEALDCPVKAAMQISVAADEIVTNIAMYAYTPGSGDVTVTFAFDAGTRTAENRLYSCRTGPNSRSPQHIPGAMTCARHGPLPPRPVFGTRPGYCRPPQP